MLCEVRAMIRARTAAPKKYFCLQYLLFAVLRRIMDAILNIKSKVGKVFFCVVVAINCAAIVYLYGYLNLHLDADELVPDQGIHDKYQIATTTTTSFFLEQQELQNSREQKISFASVFGRGRTGRKKRKPLANRARMNYTAVTETWNRVNAPWKHWASAGFCNNGTSLLEGISHDTCFRQECLFSPYYNAHIHLDRLREFQIDPNAADDAFQIFNLTWQGDLSLCRQPSGGQKPAGLGQFPEVSFLYTVSNNADVTAQSILEVFRTSHEADNAEFIIVYNTDHSTGDTPSVLTNLLRNLRLFFHVDITEITLKSKSPQPTKFRKNQQSAVFADLVAKNIGIKKARGEYVVLLDSDVLVLPGWLKLLLTTIKTYRGGFEKVGIVGPMMLDSGGKVIEAGGYVFRNGVPFNTERGYYPSDLSQHHAREVDYISSACLLVRRELFLSLNLSDLHGSTQFADIDAAFVYAQRGWKTVFQPFSVVLKLEQVNHRLLDSIVLKDSLSARTHLYNHHKNILSKHCSPAKYSIPVELILKKKHKYESLLRYERQLDVHMSMAFYRQSNRILVLEDVVPEPDRDAGSIRLYELLLILTELGYSVTFEPQPITGRSIRYVLPLLAAGVNMVMPGTLRDMASAAKTPFHDGIRQKFGPRVICPYDLLFIARRDVFERHLSDVLTLCPNVPIIFDTVDVHFIRELRMFTVKHNSTNAVELMKHDINAQEELFRVLESQRRELSYMRMSNVTLVVSTEEKKILQNLLGPQVDVRIISNIYASGPQSHHHSSIYSSRLFASNVSSKAFDGTLRKDGAHEEEERSGAIFVGNMCHTPNVDAVDFIVRHVLSDASRLPPHFKMHFVWSRSLMCKNEILANAEQHPLVKIHRDISNEMLFLLHKNVKVVLAPLRYGAGVKGKVNYALLHGVPVIATRVASEGMGLVHEKSFLLAETGEEFIDAIQRLYHDRELFSNLVKGGQKVMREMFGRDVAKERIRKTFNDLQIIAKSEYPQCPLLDQFDSSIETHISSAKKEGRPIFFPLYPRISYTNNAYLNY